MAEYRVRAFNTATDSDNRIHSDDVARRFGFRGGLVPGVDVYAYLTHPVVARWGVAWLQRGTMRVRFHQPVYDGEEVTISLTPGGDDALTLELRDPRGSVCAAAEANLPARQPGRPDAGRYPRASAPPHRPVASPESLAVGTRLGDFEFTATGERGVAYRAAVRETLPLYSTEHIVHPGALLRAANYILASSVRLGPWIHVGSTVQYLGLAHEGEAVVTRGHVTAHYERKGHRFVDLDLLTVAGTDERPVAHVLHTAIYEPRQLQRAEGQ